MFKNLKKKKEGKVISFHLRPCLLKSLEFSEIFDLRYHLARTLFSHNFFRAHQNALHVLNQCIEFFHLSYQPHLYDQFRLILLMLILLIIPNLGH